MNKLFLLCLPLVFSPVNLWAAKPPAPPVSADLPSKVLTGKPLEDYLRVFNDVMTNHKTDKPYLWRTGSANGSILVSKEYISKDNSTCRTFSEGYIIDGKAGQTQGIVCKKEDNTGWCRLTYEDPRTCNPKKPEEPADVDPDTATEEGE